MRSRGVAGMRLLGFVDRNALLKWPQEFRAEMRELGRFVGATDFSVNGNVCDSGNSTPVLDPSSSSPVVDDRAALKSSIGFLTDVEGNLSFLVRSAKFSSVIDVMEESKSGVKLEFRDSFGQFVYGGDVCDHQPGDIRVARALVDFKKRYPSRVFLLAGNRDINKLRFSSELWPLMGDQQKATKHLQHMLRRTMGSTNAFAARKQELEEISGNSNRNDFDVTTSFSDSVRPGGFMIEYLKHAQLGVVLGDSLFVHGAVPEDGIGLVPPSSESDGETFFDDAKGWIEKLNFWYWEQLAQWEANPHSQSSAALLKEYGRPRGFGGKGIVYNDWLDKDFLPAPVPDAVSCYLMKSGIRRVLSGHRPHGTTPTIVRDHNGFTVISADTSYSDKSSKDGRGRILYEIKIINEQGRESCTRVRGIMKDGKQYDFTVEDHHLVGKRISKNGEKGHVKGVLHGNLLVCFPLPDAVWSSDLKYEMMRIDSKL